MAQWPRIVANCKTGCEQLGAAVPKRSMPDLNDAQRSAVLHGDGPLLVFAGAGSGKTRVITYRIARLLSEGVPPYRILAVTFTNKAAAELRHRLETLAGDLARDLWMGTFHSLSARLLRRYGSELGLSQRFSIYDESDQKALITRVIRDGGFDERSLVPKACLGRIHAKKREGILPADLAPTFEFDDALLSIYSGYEKALRAADAVDFDDLILHMVKLLETRPSPGSLTGHAGEELRNKYDYVLVDEFQDTNAIQYRWVRALAARTRNLCVVGDDDQSIYAWRGADIRNIRDFSRDFPDAEVIKLEQNYRSTGNIVMCAQRVIEAASERAEKKLWTAAPAGDKVVLTAMRDEREEADLVVRTLRERLRAGVPPRELAVFYRVNAQSRVLEEALRRDNLPYQIVGGMRFFERAEVKNLLAYLRFLDNPRSDADLVRVFNLPARGLGDKTLARLLSSANALGVSVFDALAASAQDPELNAGTKKKLAALQGLLEELQRLRQTLPPSELAREVLLKTGYEVALRTENTAEADARIENLAELIGSIKEYENECERAGKTAALDEYLERVSLVSDQDSIQEGSAVLLMTVHSAKGLEFDTVFLTGMEEETFPYRGLDSESNEELEEERRLAYVAITRARKRLFISYAAARMIFGQTKYLAPSRFLEQLPSEIVEHRGQSGFSMRMHAAVARARQAEYSDPDPGESWDQRLPSEDAAANRSAPSSGNRLEWKARSAPSGRALPFERPSPSARPSASARPFSRFERPAAAPGRTPPTERVVDTSVFGDLPPRTAARGRDAASRERDTAATSSGLRRGTRVYHRRFGSGVVEECEGPDKVVARFKGFGSKKVMQEFLTIEE
jgi:DNA helicase II / ATP-dependent DNA helicase PcrA